MPEAQGVVLTNRANKTEGRHINNYSTFDDSLSYRLCNTLRFGEYTPSFVMDGVEKDSISVNSRDLIDSLSLNAPFKGSIRKIKESFMVPKMAILPQNWDRIYVQPSNGDDVPDDANCILKNFPKEFSTFWKSLYDIVVANVPVNVVSEGDDAHEVTILEFSNWLSALMRMLIVGEYVYSNGALLNVCGYKASNQIRLYHSELPNASYDEFFDAVLTKVFSGIRSFVLSWKEGSVTRSLKFNGLSSEGMPQKEFYCSFRSALELLRENPTAYFATDIFFESQYWSESEHGYMGEGVVNYADYINEALFGESEDGIFTIDPFFTLPLSDDSDYSTDLKDMSPLTLDLSRILAYQIACAHFYSNSSVDVVYTAELYRQYVHSFYRSIQSGSTSYLTGMGFDWNGMTCNYDYLSGHCLRHSMWWSLTADDYWTWNYEKLSELTSSAPFRLATIAAIFAFRRSLRYGDYFVGSRPRPLAPINTDVSVDNSKVSVIDITKSIQAQRFANSVMRSRQKIEEYVKSLFGKAPQPDYHNPFFLSREVETIFGDDVQNTAEGQLASANSRTSNFASSQGRFTFTFRNDDMHPCIYLQIISFDIKRAYTRCIERQFFIQNRYDMFNPDFQYIGDQPIYGMELGFLTGSTVPDVFGYQTRDEEYKQRYDQACGGFVDNLPGWILTDKDQSRRSTGHLDPDFIRSYNSELDQFFLSLAGFSLGSYFHFICITDNNVRAERAMAVDPQILA